MTTPSGWSSRSSETGNLDWLIKMNLNTLSCVWNNLLPHSQRFRPRSKRNRTVDLYHVSSFGSSGLPTHQLLDILHPKTQWRKYTLFAIILHWSSSNSWRGRRQISWIVADGMLLSIKRKINTNIKHNIVEFVKWKFSSRSLFETAVHSTSLCI